MDRNTVHGCLDRCSGFVREFWGEITGNQELFEAGLRQRMIGRVECYNKMNHLDAQQQIDQLKTQESGP